MKPFPNQTKWNSESDNEIQKFSYKKDNFLAKFV